MRTLNIRTNRHFGRSSGVIYQTIRWLAVSDIELVQSTIFSSCRHKVLFSFTIIFGQERMLRKLITISLRRVSLTRIEERHHTNHKSADRSLECVDDC